MAFLTKHELNECGNFEILRPNLNIINRSRKIKIKPTTLLLRNCKQIKLSTGGIFIFTNIPFPNQSVNLLLAGIGS